MNNDKAEYYFKEVKKYTQFII